MFWHLSGVSWAKTFCFCLKRLLTHCHFLMVLRFYMGHQFQIQHTLTARCLYHPFKEFCRQFTFLLYMKPLLYICPFAVSEKIFSLKIWLNWCLLIISFFLQSGKGPTFITLKKSMTRHYWVIALRESVTIIKIQWLKLLWSNLIINRVFTIDRLAVTWASV